MNIRYTEAPGIEGKVIRIDGWEEDGHRMTGNGHWMIFDPSTGEELARGTDWISTPTEAEAVSWQEKAKELAAKWKGRVTDLNKTLYIRYGRFPPSGQSRNYASGMLETGISVYPAKYDLVSGGIIFDDNYGVWQDGTLISVMHRTPYLVEGEYVGDGSDGEPLLRNARKVAKLVYNQEKRCFFIRGRVEQAERSGDRRQ